jgi:hypothetical protein
MVRPGRYRPLFRRSPLSRWSVRPTEYGQAACSCGWSSVLLWPKPPGIWGRHERLDILIPAKDRPALLREAVESVVAQTYMPVEIIIVLTGATAATKTDAEGLSKRFTIRLVETAPLNLAATRNAGLAVAKGDWVSCLDDDDVWLPEKLAKQMQMASSAARRPGDHQLGPLRRRYGGGAVGSERQVTPASRSRLQTGACAQ